MPRQLGALMVQSFKDTLKGVGEIFIFMPEAIRRFSGEKRDAVRSFIYPLMFYPVILLAFSNRNDITDPATLLFHALVCWAGLFGFFAILWWATAQTDRRDRFWLFVNVMNCQWILSMAIFAVGVIGYNVAHGMFEQYWIFYLLVDLLYTAFIITYTLKFPWQLGGFWAILNLFISDIGFRLVMAAHERLFS